MLLSAEYNETFPRKDRGLQSPPTRTTRTRLAVRLRSTDATSGPCRPGPVNGVLRPISQQKLGGVVTHDHPPARIVPCSSLTQRRWENDELLAVWGACRSDVRLLQENWTFMSAGDL